MTLLSLPLARWAPFALPLAEVCALFALDYFSGKHVGSANPTLWLAPIMTFGVWVTRFRGEPRAPSRFSRRWLVANLTLFVLTALMLLALPKLGGDVVKAVAAIMVVASAFFVTCEETLKQELAERRCSLVALAALGAFLRAVYSPLNRLVGPYLVYAVGKLIFLATQALGITVMASFIDGNYYLYHNVYRLIIAVPCSGMNGITFFLLGYTLVYLHQWPAFRRRGLTIAMLGVAFMFVLNVTRIALVYFYSIWLYSHWDQATADRWSTGFHSNVGWLLYLIAMAAFFFIVIRMLGLRSRHTSNRSA